MVQEYWRITDMNHAWSGGSVFGSYTDPRGPDATQAMWAFFNYRPDAAARTTIDRHRGRGESSPSRSW